MSTAGAPPEGSEADPLLGRVLAGKLELLELLGSGAMGRVYRAHHRGLDKTVAIKVLNRTEDVHPDLVRRFQAEARAASRLDHPNSLRILDFGEDGPDRLLYIAMEFLDGEDLSRILRREGRLDGARAADLMTQVLAALSVAHQQGVVHRDMKPGNIMILERFDETGARHEVVKVCDFGLAKLLDTPLEDAKGAPLTKQGMIMGTPAYMSPEQATGVPLDGLSDLYSCGVILFQMLTGQTPFTAESTAGVLIKQLTEEPPPILELAPDADPGLAAIAHRAMRKKKEERFSSAREMMLAVRAAGERAASLAPAPGHARPRSEAPPPKASPGRAAPSGRGPATHASGAQAARPLAEPPAPAISSTAPSFPGTSSQTALPDPTRRWGLFGAIAGSVALFAAGIAVALVVSRGGPSLVEVAPLPPDEAAGATDAGDEPSNTKKVASAGGARRAARPAAKPAERGSAEPREPDPSGDRSSGSSASPHEPRGTDPRGTSGAKGTVDPDDPTPPIPADGSGEASARPDAAIEPRATETPAIAAADAGATAGGRLTGKAGLAGGRIDLGALGRHTKLGAGDAAGRGAKAGDATPATEGDAKAVEKDTKPATDTSERPVQPTTPADAGVAVEPPKHEPAKLPEEGHAKKLGDTFRVEAELAGVAISGGVSVNRSTVALERQLPMVKECLRTAIAKLGVATKGVLEVSGRIDQYGSLRDVRVKGPLVGADACVASAFGAARLPKLDTGGEATLRFQLRYAASP